MSYKSHRHNKLQAAREARKAERESGMTPDKPSKASSWNKNSNPVPGTGRGKASYSICKNKL